MPSRVGSGDIGVVVGHQKRLSGNEVRSGEADPLLASIGDGVRRDDVVDLTVLDQGFTLGGRCFPELDVVLGHTELLGYVLGDLDVETGERAVWVAQTQARLVVLDADDEVATFGARRHAALLVSATGGCDDGQRGEPCTET